MPANARVGAKTASHASTTTIAACPGSEACGCDLTAPIGLSQPTVSHHLKVLHEAGLLDRERRGKWVYFRVRPEPLASLRSALSA